MRWGLALAIIVVGAGCRAASSTTTETPTVAPKVEVTLPVAPMGPLAPSLVRANGPAHPGDRIADVETCATCHTDVSSQWRKSAHAFASFNNPVYRVAVEKLRKDRSEKASQFCGGCHDVSLMVDDAMTGVVEPTDLRAHAGITCATCHGIERTRPDGNASFDLDTSPIPLPKDGDPASNVRHRERVGRTTLRTNELCLTCHKAFLDEGSGNTHHLVGQDDATPWARSAYAGSDGARVDREIEKKDCRGCHMPRVPAVENDPGAKKGTVASHWFLGGHTWLASMESDPEHLARVQAFMKERVSLDVGGVRHEAGTKEIVAGGPVAVVPGENLVIDLVVRNLDVGHRFPGGVMDAQDTWLEVVVLDASGARVAEAGTDQEKTGADPTAHVLTSYMAKSDGTRLVARETHEFRANVWNHTLAPRDAAVVGYELALPDHGYPLTVSARLRHRSRTLALQKVACDDTKSPRGVSFGAVGLKKVARAIDACKVQPITDLASTSVRLGTIPARAPEAREVAFERRYAYALGLSHALQEHLDDARAPLVRAFEVAETPRERAMVTGLLAQIASHEGRTDETFEWAAKTDAELGSPAVSMQRARADVLAATWRLAEAAPLYVDAARRSPLDDASWAVAAVTLAGAGDARGALDVARRGLLVQPRDADMLRVQSLSLSSLHAEPKLLAPAEAAFLERRTPDDAPQIRGRCSAKVPGCANERIPVHVHAMRQR